MSFHQRQENKLNRVISSIFNSETFEQNEYYGTLDQEGFCYQGFICTPKGILRFGLGRYAVVTKKYFELILKSCRTLKITFEALIKSWQVKELWDQKTLEKRLVRHYDSMGLEGG